MSVRFNFTISAPKTEWFYDRFVSFTHRFGDTRVLFEVSKPNLSDFVDLRAEYLDSSESANPGLYLNFVLFGLGLHLTAYKVPTETV